MVLKPVPLNVPVKLAMAPRSSSGCAASAARPRLRTDGTCPHRKPRVRSRAGSVGTVSVMTQYHILFLLPNAGQMVPGPVSYTHLRAHETRHELVCRLLLEK